MQIDKMTIVQIKQFINALPEGSREEYIDQLYSDERKQIREFAQKLKSDAFKLSQEKLRIENMKRTEEYYYNQGLEYIAGTDEVGRGPLCGPVVSAVVVLPRHSAILHINDSKKLTEKKRIQLSEQIKKEAVSYAFGIVENKVIDEINILNATKLSMKQALSSLNVKPDILLLDAIKIDDPIKQESFVRGDQNIYSIAAASIIAKVERDKLMQEYDSLYPEYNLASNKGYASDEHIKAIKEYGPCNIHRMSFLNNILDSHNNKTAGAVYEEAAANYLKNKGFKILNRNFKRGLGEIDIIAMNKNTLVFIEVKARSRNDFGSPEDFVDNDKQQRISDAASIFISEKNLYGHDARFDVLAMDIISSNSYKIRHYENAFEFKSGKSYL